MVHRHNRFLLIVLITVVAVSVTTAVGGGATAQTTGGFVTGTVTSENADALPNATVEVYIQGDTTPVRTTTTNELGEYSISDLAGGVDYRIEAAYAGETGQTTVSVQSGQTSTADIIILGASPGPQTGGISGVITDAANEPLADTTARLQVDKTTVETAQTDSDGQYAFTDVEVGEYRIEAEASGETGFTTVSVDQDQTSTADVVVTGTPASATGDISGTVRTETCEPIVDASVQLLDPTTGTVISATSSASDGTYAFRSIPAGEYRVEAELSGDSGVATIAVQQNTTTTADITITGTASSPETTGRLRGTVTTEAGEPISDAVIRVREQPLGFLSGIATSNDTSYFELPELEPGEYRIVAKSQGETGAKPITLSGNAPEPQTIVIPNVSVEDGPEATVLVGAPDEITSGESAEILITTQNTGADRAESGGLQFDISGPATVSSVRGDGTSSPDRFYVAELDPCASWATTYTIQVPDGATGTVELGVTASFGSGATDSKNVSISVAAENVSLAEHFRDTNRDVTFQDILRAIEAFNSEDSELSGYGTVTFRDILGVIEAYTS